MIALAGAPCFVAQPAPLADRCDDVQRKRGDDDRERRTEKPPSFARARRDLGGAGEEVGRGGEGGDGGASSHRHGRPATNGTPVAARHASSVSGAQRSATTTSRGASPLRAACVSAAASSAAVAPPRARCRHGEGAAIAAAHETAARAARVPRPSGRGWCERGLGERARESRRESSDGVDQSRAMRRRRQRCRRRAAPTCRSPAASSVEARRSSSANAAAAATRDGDIGGSASAITRTSDAASTASRFAADGQRSGVANARARRRAPRRRTAPMVRRARSPAAPPTARAM